MMKSLATHTSNNVAPLDKRDMSAGGASHLYGVQLPDRSVIKIQFQHGPRGEEQSTLGLMEDDLLAILQDRLETFQAGPFACPENDVAVGYIKLARDFLAARVAERMQRGVLGALQK
jgi:hypothetical protein